MNLSDTQLLALVWYSWPVASRNHRTAPNPRTQASLVRDRFVHFSDGAMRLTYRGEQALRGEMAFWPADEKKGTDR